MLFLDLLSIHILHYTYTTTTYKKVIGGIRGCAYCSGLGHRITNCPKLEGDQNKKFKSGRDILVGKDY